MAKADESQARRTAEEMEARTAKAAERLVSRDSFGELLARTTENAMALTKMGFDAMDLVVRNLRLAGRRDITNLGRQLARTEDKLEMVLQEVERLRQELDGARASSGGQGRRSGGQGGRSRRQQR